MASLLYEQEPQGQINDSGSQSRDGEKWLLSNEQFFDAFVLGAETPTVNLAATEQSDTASVTSTVNASVAATESADVVTINVQPDTTPMSLAATEQADVAAFTSTANALLSTTEASDTASFTTTVNVVLGSTEAADVASASVFVTVVLATTEQADVAAFAASENGTVALAATESGDTANAGLEPAGGSSGGGGTLVRFSSPGSAYINAHRITIRRARKKVQAAKVNPLLAQEREFQQALNEAYLALSQLILLVEAKERARLEQEVEELRKQALQVELESLALLEKKRLEDDEEELLAANLW